MPTAESYGSSLQLHLCLGAFDSPERIESRTRTAATFLTMLLLRRHGQIPWASNPGGMDVLGAPGGQFSKRLEVFTPREPDRYQRQGVPIASKESGYLFATRLASLHQDLNPASEVGVVANLSIGKAALIERLEVNRISKNGEVGLSTSEIRMISDFADHPERVRGTLFLMSENQFKGQRYILKDLLVAFVDPTSENPSGIVVFEALRHKRTLRSIKDFLRETQAMNLRISGAY